MYLHVYVHLSAGADEGQKRVLLVSPWGYCCELLNAGAVNQAYVLSMCS